ncbi:MAG: hypothetical protein FWC06_00920 [Treponema sp.]|nr:hypothetical protein [Treponema sp.]
MTLSERNIFFKAGIAFCAVCVLLITAASVIIIPGYQDTDSNLYLRLEEMTQRPSSVFHALTSRFLEKDYYAVHASLAVLSVFSLTGMILIYYFFERTSAPEILYIAIFIISLSFEVIRLILPLHLIYSFSSVYIRTSSQILLFARFFGVFSLFAASICSAGLEVQKIRYVIFTMIIAAMIITISVPIDVLNWDTGINIITGFGSIFRGIELVVFITTTVSFLITARNHDSRGYIHVAIGIMLVLAGRHILLNTDNWAGPLPGISMLIFGTWFICTKLHKIHLWL